MKPTGLSFLPSLAALLSAKTASPLGVPLTTAVLGARFPLAKKSWKVFKQQQPCDWSFQPGLVSSPRHPLGPYLTTGLQGLVGRRVVPLHQAIS